MTTTTPGMGLTIPEVQVTIGPDWAEDINNCLEIIDQHSHTSGEGNQIPTAGLNLNADLSYNNYGLTSVDRVELVSQLAALDSQRSIYSVNGDLYYTNTAGDQVQITNGNSIAGIPGAITGLGDGGSSGVYYDVTDTLAFYYDSTAQAKLDISTIQIHPYEVGPSPTFTPIPHPEFIGLAAPTTLASSYTLTLPAALPAQSLPISVKTDGSILYGADAGAAATPSIAFAADLDTGLYSASANTIGIAAGGAQVGSWSSAGLRAVAGSASAPAYSFISDTNTGMYAVSADQLAFATNGTQQLLIDTADITLRLPALGVAGSASAPMYTFNGDSNTGMYRYLSDIVGFAAGGAQVATISADGITSGGNVPATHAIKWKVFTGSLNGGASTTLTNPGSILLGAVGVSSETNGGSIGSPIVDMVGGTSTKVSWKLVTSPDLGVQNDAGTARQYKVVMYYQ